MLGFLPVHTGKEAGARDVLPFGLARKSVDLSRRLRQPVHIGLGVIQLTLIAGRSRRPQSSSPGTSSAQPPASLAGVPLGDCHLMDRPPATTRSQPSIADPRLRHARSGRPGTPMQSSGCFCSPCSQATKPFDSVSRSVEDLPPCQPKVLDPDRPVRAAKRRIDAHEFGRPFAGSRRPSGRTGHPRRRPAARSSAHRRTTCGPDRPRRPNGRSRTDAALRLRDARSASPSTTPQRVPGFASHRPYPELVTTGAPSGRCRPAAHGDSSPHCPPRTPLGSARRIRSRFAPVHLQVHAWQSLRSPFIAGHGPTQRRRKALAWSGVGRPSMSAVAAPGTAGLTQLRVRVARSASRLWKLRRRSSQSIAS